MLGFLLLLAAGLGLAATLVVGVTIHRLTHPPRRTIAWALARGRPADPGEMTPPRAFDAFTIAVPAHPNASRRLEVPVWDVAGEDPAGPVVVLTPGWGDSRLGALVRLPAFASRARRCILWDPPGLGEAPGTCALGTREVAQLAAVVERIRELHAGPIALAGWSLGAGVSIAAAAAAAPAGIVGVVAEAPYREAWTPAARVLRQAGLPHRWNVPIAFPVLALRLGGWRGFDRALHAARLACPLLVVHGDADGISPLEDGRAIASAAPDGELAIVAGGGHNDLWTDADLAPRTREIVSAWLGRLAPAVSRAGAR